MFFSRENEKSNIFLAKNLINKGIDVNVPNVLRTIISKSYYDPTSVSNTIDFIQWMIKNGLNLSFSVHKYILFESIINYSNLIVEFLLKNGIYINELNDNSNNVLMFYISHMYQYRVEHFIEMDKIILLLEYGTSLDQINNDGDSILHISIKNLPIISLLLEYM